jgi:hypothetical protein
MALAEIPFVNREASPILPEPFQRFHLAPLQKLMDSAEASSGPATVNKRRRLGPGAIEAYVAGQSHSHYSRAAHILSV